MPLSAGAKLGPYEILSPIGAGGMGEVYKARDARLDRTVAIKVLPERISERTDLRARFEREARAASALNHPNIITIHEIGEISGTHYIVTEYVEGETLRQRMSGAPQGRLGLAEVLDVAVQIAAALAAAHGAGIIHRDIKPENVMVRRDGIVKVLDFGLAKLIEPSKPLLAAEVATETATSTETGMVMGTVAYMSPERLRAEAADPSADIWSLGVVLYEVIAGRRPFAGTTTTSLIASILEHEPPPLRSFALEIPPALERVIHRILLKTHEQRCQTAQELLDELKRLRQELEFAARSQPHERVSFETAPAAPAAAQQRASRRTVGREPERNELRAAFNAAKAGRGSLLCVAGEPGLGKTTLVEDFLAELAAEGQCTIARGRCSERLAGTEAYLPLLEALDSLLQTGSSPARAQAMKQIAPTWYAQVAPLSGDSEESARLLAEVKAASQERMKRELANFLHAVAQSQPLVLFFDDLHWADVSTIDLLSFLAGKFDALRVLIVTTYRPSDLLLSEHPFLRIKSDLQARGACRELLLGFLNGAEIAEYLALEFPGHRFPPEFPKVIHAKTEGSPLFMADLVRYLRDRTVITQASGAWTLAEALPELERELPESVRGMIERKIAQLEPEDRKLLTAASVQGYEFDSAVMAQALKLDADEIEERLEKLERVYAFVKLTSEAEFPNRTFTLKYRFVHVLYQNALYASLRATRKVTLSREVAQALEGCYGVRSASVANELALLWEAARESARAADYFLQAARNAALIHAPREAAPLAERGLEALRKLPETPQRDGRELALQLALGSSLQSGLSWAAPETGAAFHRARQLCQQMGDDSRLFAALIGVWAYHHSQAEIETALGLCEQMLRLGEQSQNPVLLAIASMCGAKVHYNQGDLVSSRQLGERALALDRREYHEAYLSVYNEDGGTAVRREHSFCLWTLGYPDRALALANEAVTLAEQTSHPFSLGAAHHAKGAVLALIGDWQSSQKEFEKLLALAEEYALGDMLKYATATNALNLAYQERTEEALERAKQAIESLNAQGVKLARPRYLARMGKLLWTSGRRAEGLAAIAEALALAENTGERCWNAEVWRIKGELLLEAAASNAQAEAEGCYNRAMEIARQQSAKSWELRTTMNLARLWQLQGKIVEARQMLAGVYGWFTEGFDTRDLREARALLDELS
jgi:predicted ATPase/tRNA A-37 threonylcarbamoyl transferase component Bud32